MAKTKGIEPAMKEDDWEVRADLDAVARAHSVRKDLERMKKVHALAKRKLDESKRRKDEAQHMITLGKKGEAKEARDG